MKFVFVIFLLFVSACSDSDGGDSSGNVTISGSGSSS